jgi:hypothetical protein
MTDTPPGEAISSAYAAQFRINSKNTPEGALFIQLKALPMVTSSITIQIDKIFSLNSHNLPALPDF